MDAHSVSTNLINFYSEVNLYSDIIDYRNMGHFCCEFSWQRKWSIINTFIKEEIVWWLGKFRGIERTPLNLFKALDVYSLLFYSRINFTLIIPWFYKPILMPTAKQWVFHLKTEDQRISQAGRDPQRFLAPHNTPKPRSGSSVQTVVELQNLGSVPTAISGRFCSMPTTFQCQTVL